MKDTSKKTLKNVFASLISNDSAIDGAKTAPWWIAIIFLILGTFMPIIPIMVSSSKSYGASFMSGYTYGYEQALASASNDMMKDGYSFKINDSHQLLAYKDGNLLEVDAEAGINLVGYYDSDEKYNGADTKYRALNVYYTDRPFSGVKALRKTIEATKYYLHSNVVLNSVEDETQKQALIDASEGKSYIPSYVILYKEGLVSRIYKYASESAAASTYDGCDWKKFEADTDLLTKVCTVEGYDLAKAEENVKDIKYVEGVKANWANVYNKAYQNKKVQSFWFTSGLYYGIYLVLAFFMGLLMFLLTRGKNNPNHNLTLWHTVKISMWIDFTPGLLAMILGFVWSPTAGIGYIALMGIRTMWLSMRQLNPSAQ